jgi:ribosomal-protein-alanine N-acetyltransferase
LAVDPAERRTRVSRSPDPTFTIRPCREDDIDQVLMIEAEAFPDPYDRSTFVQLLATDPEGFFVAESDGKVVGYVTGACNADDGMVYSIAVDRSSMRRGIGRQLMQAEIDYMAGKAHRIWLQVSVTNTAAISLYESFSFVEKGRLRNYYRNHEDAILMCLVLSPSALKHP